MTLISDVKELLAQMKGERIDYYESTNVGLYQGHMRNKKLYS